MTTPPPSTKASRNRRPTADGTAAPDALDGLPPMPKTKAPKAKTVAKKPATPGTDRIGAGPDTAPGDGPPTVTKKELFTRVKARSGKVKGSDVRVVMDALLNEIGEALVAGETLKLPALGTMKVQRHKTQARADVVVCKLNRKKPGTRAKDPLAKPAEDS